MFDLTSSGLVLQDTSELLARAQKVFTDIWPDINTDAATPQGQIITELTDILAECQSRIAELANVFYLGGNGKWLDLRNQTFFGIVRRPASPNMIDVKIVGQPLYKIKAGFEISDVEGIYKFVLDKDIVINASGEITTTFISNEDLSNAAIALGQINTVVTDVNDNIIESVSNTSFLFKAVPLESDGNFYNRSIDSINFRSSSVFGAGLAHIRQVTGVTRAEGKENITNVVEEYKKVELPPHSITYVIEGGDVEEVAKAILSKKNPGCALGGDVIVDVVDNVSNTTYNVSFFRPIYTPLYIKCTVKEQLLDNKNYADTLNNRINEYLTNIRIGTDIYATELLNTISDVNFIITDFKIFSSPDKIGDGKMVAADFKTIFTVVTADIEILTA